LLARLAKHADGLRTVDCARFAESGPSAHFKKIYNAIDTGPGNRAKEDLRTGSSASGASPTLPTETSMLNYVTSSFVTLALVIDPIGLAPAFIALTQDLDALQKRALALRSSAIAAAILIVTALLGNWFLAQLRIGLAAFQISGGILLFGVATRMIFGEHVRQQSRDAESAAREKIADLAAFPLAIPLIAGPGAITATLLLASRAGDNHPWLLALVVIIVAVALVSALSFLLADRLARIMGRTGNIVLARLLGIVLAAFATQFVVDGIKGAFPWAG
jgi:multiple antibiotic resistance protein